MSFPLVFSAILGITEVYAFGFFLAAIPALVASAMLFRPDDRAGDRADQAPARLA